MSYLAICFFCLLNILLAVLVDAYVAVKDESSKGDLDTPIWRDISTIIRTSWQKNITHRDSYLSDEQMLTQLNALLSAETVSLENQQKTHSQSRSIRVIKGVDLDRWELARLLLATLTDKSEHEKQNNIEKLVKNFVMKFGHGTDIGEFGDKDEARRRKQQLNNDDHSHTLKINSLKIHSFNKKMHNISQRHQTLAAAAAHDKNSQDIELTETKLA